MNCLPAKTQKKRISRRKPKTLFINVEITAGNKNIEIRSTNLRYVLRKLNDMDRENRI